MSKWALRGLTKTVAAVELAPRASGSTCLIPGAIEGPMLPSNVPAEMLADPAHWVGYAVGAGAGRPEEVADGGGLFWPAPNPRT